MRTMRRLDAHRLLRLRDFAARSAGHPGGVYVHAASGTRYLPIHPFADEADLLARIGASPEGCRGVDAYWEIGGDVCFLEVWSAADRHGIFARWSDGKLPMLHLAARVRGQTVTRPLFEQVIAKFVRAGVPTDPRFGPDIGDGLVQVDASARNGSTASEGEVSLTIGIAVAGTQPVELDADTRVDFEDDGYYWFLYPQFERLAARTGQMIDLYDGATFSGPALADLRATVNEAMRLVETMPDEWDVQTGTEIGSRLHPKPPTPVYSPVKKMEFERLLRRVGELVDAAERKQARIVCLGD